MTRDDALAAVLEAVGQIQRLSGRALPLRVVGHDPLVGCIEGFDSLAALEAMAALESLLDVELPTQNVFVTPDGRRAHTLDETVDLVLAATRAVAQS